MKMIRVLHKKRHGSVSIVLVIFASFTDAMLALFAILVVDVFVGFALASCYREHVPLIHQRLVPVVSQHFG